MLRNKKGAFWIFLGVAIFVSLLWRLGFRQSWEKLAHINPVLLSVGLLLMAFTLILEYAKWKVMYLATMEDHSR